MERALERLKAVQDLWDHLMRTIPLSEKEKPFELTVKWTVLDLDGDVMPEVTIKKG